MRLQRVWWHVPRDWAIVVSSVRGVRERRSRSHRDREPDPFSRQRRQPTTSIRSQPTVAPSVLIRCLHALQSKPDPSRRRAHLSGWGPAYFCSSSSRRCLASLPGKTPQSGEVVMITMRAGEKGSHLPLRCTGLLGRRTSRYRPITAYCFAYNRSTGFYTN